MLERPSYNGWVDKTWATAPTTEHLITVMWMTLISQCTDDDNRSYRNVCNMSFVSFSLAVIFIIMTLIVWNRIAFFSGVIQSLVKRAWIAKQCTFERLQQTINWNFGNVSVRDKKQVFFVLAFLHPFKPSVSSKKMFKQKWSCWFLIFKLFQWRMLACYMRVYYLQ